MSPAHTLRLVLDYYPSFSEHWAWPGSLDLGRHVSLSPSSGLFLLDIWCLGYYKAPHVFSEVLLGPDFGHLLLLPIYISQD